MQSRAQRHVEPLPAAALAEPAAAVQPEAFTVGDVVFGAFGRGTATYIVPAGFPTAGWVEVGGDGRCDIYPQEALRRVVSRSGEVARLDKKETWRRRPGRLVRR